MTAGTLVVVGSTIQGAAFGDPMHYPMGRSAPQVELRPIRPEQQMHSVPAAVEQLLHAAKDAESAAHGSDLRDAFRTTRYLLAGCRSNGFTMGELAAVIGASTGSVRARSSADGIVSRTVFAQLTGTPPETIYRWEAQELLPAAQPDERGHPGYTASTLIAVLLRDSR